MFKNLSILTVLFVTLVINIFAQDAKTINNKEISANEAAKNALNVGGKIPAFSLPDSDGNTVNSRELLEKGNLVIVFYRGAWCPFCNTYLRSLQKNLMQIRENGGELVAISVEDPDTSMSVAQKNKLEFTVLSDSNLDVARTFGIVYQLEAQTNEKYKNYGIDLVKQNGTAKPELPLSATYVVNQKGEIVYAFLEPDYTKRAEPSIIIDVLKKLKSDSLKLKNNTDKMEKSQ